jgi:hypothetical protein
MVPAEVTRAVLAAELVATRAWVKRRCWSLSEDIEALTLTAQTVHPADNQPLVLHGSFDGYRALPPLWSFLDPVTGEPARTACPAPGQVCGQASIFHPEGFICARWSRAAYAEGGGPHGNWGAASGWLGVQEGTQASEVAEMLATVCTHLQFSPGRLS